MIGSKALAALWFELTGEKITEKAARERVYAGLIPASRLGGRIIASKAAIREHLEAAARGLIRSGEPEPSEPEPESDVVTLTCRECGAPFTYARGKAGRPPVRCPDCRQPDRAPPPPPRPDRLEPEALRERLAALLARTGMQQKLFAEHAARQGPRQIIAAQVSTFVRGHKRHGDATRDQMQAALEDLERQP